MKFDFELVGKIGSMALVNKANRDIDYNIIARISSELRPGMIWVTSGATEIGRLDYLKRNGHEIAEGDDDTQKADYSAQGQSILMQNYRQFVDQRYSVRQLLVEHQHFNDAMKRENLKNMLLRCPAQNAIPIVNYNDAVCYEENRRLEIMQLTKAGGNVVQCIDNDETASLIASLVKSRYLLLLTSVDGIYEDAHDESTLIKEISGKDVDELLVNVDGYKKCCVGASRKGANGAISKLEFIKEPIKNGTTVFIANAKYRIADILSGVAPSTCIKVK